MFYKFMLLFSFLKIEVINLLSKLFNKHKIDNQNFHRYLIN